jgi:formate dehydrogenase (NADP+) beta subunit
MVTTSVLMLLGLGLAAAVLLAIASKVLHVEEDPRIEAVEEALPGANCGGCGYAGCSGAAAAVVAGTAQANVCIVGGMEIATEVATLMGCDVEYREPEIADVGCTGGNRAEVFYAYEGANDCRAQHMLYRGSTTCSVGCLGLGSCVKACGFDAIHMGPNGLPVVDPEKCTACGACVRACPRDVIEVGGVTSGILHLNETHECLAPCRQKCPAQIDIPRYIENVRKGDFAAAVLTIKERNPLLLTCGRVCPQPCESVCRRGIVDDAVAINNLKRYVADWEMNSGMRLPIPCSPDTGHKVAVVGGGPAGLSCAYFLRRLGHHPVIFEAMPAMGGQLRYGIPEYRLPKETLDWEIQGILELGVEAHLNTNFGKDFNLDSLEEDGFEAVFMGLGAWTSPTLGCDGEDSKGVMAGIEFLTAIGLGAKVDVGQRVVVVGGGNTAIDAARTAVRLGAKVTLMYRRTRTEMPANAVEIVGAEEEGVEYSFLAAPSNVVTDDNGKVTHIEYIRMELGEPDASGRRRPVAVEGSETLLEADTIVAAIGQKPDISCLYDKDSTDCPFLLTKWRTLDADEDTLQTSNPMVFTGGDLFTGADLVVTAVGGGRRAARAIHYFLEQGGMKYAGEIPVPDDIQRKMLPGTMFKTLDDVSKEGRVKMPEMAADLRICSFEEVDGCIGDDEAQKEAERCLRCGLICYDPNKQAQESQCEVAQLTES